jgi:hypothetical protein
VATRTALAALPVQLPIPVVPASRAVAGGSRLVAAGAEDGDPVEESAAVGTRTAAAAAEARTTEPASATTIGDRHVPRRGSRGTASFPFREAVRPRPVEYRFFPKGPVSPICVKLGLVTLLSVTEGV